jgi:hypothetical protein
VNVSSISKKEMFVGNIATLIEATSPDAFFLLECNQQKQLRVQKIRGK